MTLDTSADNPAPLRVVSAAIGQWVGRLGAVWVEAQVAELTLRQERAYLVLRDPLADMSVPASCSRRVLDAMPVPVTEGARVVVHARPSYYDRRGSLSLYVDVVRPVGLGELLARIEQRRRLLAAEGLFGAERKLPLPFLPGCVGLVTGKGSAAEHDVLEVARRRWPGVRFRIEHALVQGRDAALQVIEAVRRLDADTAVDVIVVARGGGSMEDLLPFSDEGLVRVVAALRTPLVSAIGHEPDNPILDLVADVRAATPTDAAKLVVPDVAEELAGVRHARDRVRRAVQQQVAHEERQLVALRSRPSLAAPHTGLAERAGAVERCATGPDASWCTASTGPATRSGTSWPAPGRCPHWRRCGAATRWCRTPTARVLAARRPAAAGDPLTVRLHDGRLSVRTSRPSTPTRGGRR